MRRVLNRLKNGLESVAFATWCEAIVFLAQQQARAFKVVEKGYMRLFNGQLFAVWVSWRSLVMEMRKVVAQNELKRKLLRTVLTRVSRSMLTAGWNSFKLYNAFTIQKERDVEREKMLLGRMMKAILFQLHAQSHEPMDRHRAAPKPGGGCGAHGSHQDDTWPGILSVLQMEGRCCP